jgi:hypothetical protein
VEPALSDNVFVVHVAMRGPEGADWYGLLPQEVHAPSLRMALAKASEIPTHQWFLTEAGAEHD